MGAPWAHAVNLFRNSKDRAQDFSTPKISESESNGAHSALLGFGLALRWHTKGITLETLRSRAKKFRAEDF